MAKIIQLSEFAKTKVGHPVRNLELAEQRLEIARASCEHVLADLQAVLAVMKITASSTIAPGTLPPCKQTAIDRPTDI